MPPGQDDAHRVDALSRVIQGVLTGIGFLGAGVILRDPVKRHVHGLTTAAAIWLAALLGVACGAGRVFHRARRADPRSRRDHARWSARGLVQAQAFQPTKIRTRTISSRECSASSPLPLAGEG